MRKPRTKKLSEGTYLVTFTKDQKYVAVVPRLWLEMGLSERELRDIAIEAASENLPYVG